MLNFEITDLMEEQWQGAIDSLMSNLTGLGRKVTLIFPLTEQNSCPNCLNSPFGSSARRYNSSNPNPVGPLNISFSVGSCPVCFLGDTIISTPFGPRFIKDIEPNETVYDHFMDEQRVLHKYVTKYNGKFINIKMNGYSRFTCTEEHPILVKRNNKIIQLLANQILPGDIAILPIMKFSEIDEKYWFIFWQKYCKGNYWNNTIDLYEYLQEQNLSYKQMGSMFNVVGGTVYSAINRDGKTINYPADLIIDDDLLFLIGWYIAEGCVNSGPNKREITYSLHSDEAWVVEKLISIFQFKFDIKYRIETRENKENSLWVHFYSSVLARWLDDVCGHLAENKQIPWYLYNNLTLDKLEILCGYIKDGDGCTVNSEHSVTTTSKMLAFQIFNIIQSLYKLPRLSYQPPKIDKNNVKHRESWTIYYPIIKWSNLVKNRYIYNGQEERLILKTESFVKEDFVYNLEVSNTHTYIADGLSVHNCNNRGYIENLVPKQFDINMLCLPISYLDKWQQVDASVATTDTDYYAIGYMTDKENVERCDRAIMRGDTVKRNGPTNPLGLKSDKYFESAWKKISN